MKSSHGILSLLLFCLLFLVMVVHGHLPLPPSPPLLPLLLLLSLAIRYEVKHRSRGDLKQKVSQFLLRNNLIIVFLPCEFPPSLLPPPPATPRPD